MKYRTILEVDSDAPVVQENFEGFYRFIYARHLVWYKRFVLKVSQEEWTDDPILKKSRYTNVYRELDRGTVWWFDNVHKRFNKKNISANKKKDAIWRTCVYRLIDKLETFDKVGLPYLSDFRNNKTYNENWFQKIKDMLDNDEKVWTSAHITLQSNLQSSRFDNLNVVLSRLLKDIDEVSEVIYNNEDMKQGFKRLKECYGFGPFTTYEVLTDLSFFNWIKFDDDAWANAGPGCQPGIKLIFPWANKTVDYEECMDLLRDNQERAFDRYKIPFKDIAWEGKLLSLRNIEHSVCEYRKYWSQQRGVGRARPKYSLISPNTLYD